MSLRLRLALFGAAVVALALLLFGLLLYALLSRGVVTNQDDALRTRAQQAVKSLDASPQLVATSVVAPADLKTSTDIFLEVFDPGWSVLYSTAQPIVAPDSHRAGFVTQSGFRLYAVPFNQGYVVTGQSTRVPQSNLSGIVAFLIVSAVPSLIAALIASWLVAGRALAPLRAVAQLAGTIGVAEDVSRMRLPSARSRDEVARLTGSFNAMLDRLQGAFDSQRRFVADASHELRTPLTTIQGNAGLLARGPAINEEVRQAAATDIAEEGARMSRLLDRLLTLARADSGLRLRLAPVDFKALIDEVCRQASALHPEMPLSSDTAPASIDGDEDALRQLAWILLDNAFRYARSTVDVQLHVESGWARLGVGDDGPGVAAGERERIFERFYRAERSRAGSHSGLGLSIAAWIVTEHNGRILAGQATIGGASFLVDLPLLRAS
ncbi:MAG TPA: HAMP domain-containing sensor histidine kinase [Candidatus Dormibacteraeota bacterium]|nr:HAMP domain-containing sensor histidine kinase [Candidatus Dormibacteraeota bacterium]